MCSRHSCWRRQWHPTPVLLPGKSHGWGAWYAAVHGVAKSRTRLSDFIITFHFHALEKKMATHSSTLAGRIPGMGEPGWLTSMGSHRVGHNWSDLPDTVVKQLGNDGWLLRWCFVGQNAWLLHVFCRLLLCKDNVLWRNKWLSRLLKSLTTVLAVTQAQASHI